MPTKLGLEFVEVTPDVAEMLLELDLPCDALRDGMVRLDVVEAMRDPFYGTLLASLGGPGDADAVDVPHGLVGARCLWVIGYAVQERPWRPPVKSCWSDLA